MDRYVTRTGKDRDGDILSLCSGDSWSPRPKAGAITDIESGLHQYWVQWPERTTAIRVVQGSHGKYLRTDRDATSKNNLDDLPDC